MIKFFGCSFTEGGGLDNIDYYNYIENPKQKLTYWPENSTHQTRKDIVDFLENYKIQNRFTTILEKNINHSIKNYAKSQSSNDCILETLFKEIDENSNEIYFVILSLPQRRYWYYEIDNKKHNLNMLDFASNPFDNNEEYKGLYEHYKTYLQYIFNENIEIENICRNIKLFDSFAEFKNSKIIWSAWEMGDYQTKLENLTSIAKNSLLFDGLSLKHFCIKEKLQIHTETNGIVNDNHISKYGNKIIAQKIEEYIIQNKLL